MVNLPLARMVKYAIFPGGVGVPYCIALHCIALHCIALHCIALHCIALHCIALHCIALHCIALHCIALHCIALHCIALHCIALHCMAWHGILKLLCIVSCYLDEPVLFRWRDSRLTDRKLLQSARHTLRSVAADMSKTQTGKTDTKRDQDCAIDSWQLNKHRPTRTNI